MSILKKLFGRSKGETAGLGDQASRESFRNRRQSPRIQINGIRGVRLTVEGREVSISTLSVHGVGWTDSGHNGKRFEPGSRVGASIELEGRQYSMQLEIRYQRESRFGGRFEKVDVDLARAIREKFQAEIIGTQLKAIDPALLKAEPEGTPLWFQDKGGHEVYALVDINSQSVRRFRISFLGHFFEGTGAGVIQSGLVLSDTEVTDPGFNRVYGEGQLTQIEPAGQDEVAHAIGFLTHAEVLPNWLRLQLIALLERGLSANQATEPGGN